VVPFSAAVTSVFEEEGSPPSSLSLSPSLPRLISLAFVGTDISFRGVACSWTSWCKPERRSFFGLIGGMEANRWRPVREEASAAASDGISADWRAQLDPEARQRVVEQM
ncbi:hypothetical protein BHE74_00027093, partial [Ensete ventricosum]